jgi:hypothetical protein
MAVNGDLNDPTHLLTTYSLVSGLMDNVFRSLAQPQTSVLILTLAPGEQPHKVGSGKSFHSSSNRDESWTLGSGCCPHRLVIV